MNVIGVCYSWPSNQEKDAYFHFWWQNLLQLYDYYKHNIWSVYDMIRVDANPVIVLEGQKQGQRLIAAKM